MAKVSTVEILKTHKIVISGTVSYLLRTKREDICEYVFTTYSGVCFGTIDDATYEYTNHAETEKYCNGKTVVSIFEYDLDKFAAAICNSAEYAILFDRATKAELKSIKNPYNTSTAL